MSISQSHFQFIAAVLKQGKPNTQDRKQLDQWRDTVRRFAIECAVANGKFKPSLFYRACGMEG
ncbi:hypothetical protein [Bradyrhizobium erythrophlei]|jgi:hypothetical protein|uniref:Uncharacterized protein n=1 Tax=Bradyrhizobium erythrophlei TaxID=1437360 RepID=A0A1M5NIF2_9BRAD|nr:hypothetical protein [Bradyrhizobium erythrophlei]SHG89272.1 hypothetical protein SAMN05443248_3008 [Bradyrhizobium erythrophlei]